MERKKIQETVNTIFKLIAMKDNDLYGLAKYILSLRNDKYPFNMDDINKGIDRLLKKLKNK